MHRRLSRGFIYAAAPLALSVTTGCAASPASNGPAADAGEAADSAVDAATTVESGGFEDAGAPDARIDDSGSGAAIDADSGPPVEGGVLAFETHCTHAGKIYYVAPTGSDAASGTASAPWASVAHAAAHVAPGDTVQILGGTYSPTSTQDIPSVGTSTAWICFEAAPGQTPVWDGSHIKNADVFHISGQYVALLGQQVQSSTLHGIEVETAHFVDLVDDVVHGSAWAAITIGPSGADMTSTTDVRVHGCEVYDNGLAGSGAPGVTTGTWPAITRSFGATRVSFTSNVVHDNYGEGIDFILTDQGEATDNVAYDNYSVNMYLDNASHVTVARNLVYWTNTNTALLRKDNHQSPAGIQMSEEQEYTLENKLVGNVVVDNIVIGGSSGINYGTYGRNLGMEGCTFAGNTVYAGAGKGPPLSIGASTGHQGNAFVDNIFVGGPVYAPATASEFTYGHNLFFDVSNASSLSGTGDVVADPGFASAGAFVATAYRVGAGSPARAAGVASPALTVDFGGQARPDPPTLGAWEAP